jgi:hypothetical protein
MIITLELQKLLLSNIYFLDKKRNIIMDGNFTKIMYSNDKFTMNGLYILFPIETISNERNSNMFRFNPHNTNNVTAINDISKLEYRIIEYYKNTFQCKGKISNLLSKQLYLGSLKLYKEQGVVDNNILKKYVIKISGVWESQDEVGITYKLVEVNENYL